jgi:coniferyl-aldehyde dehydrogenase
MDPPLKSAGQNALENAFHRMFELTRITPAPTLAERLDRLARLRAVISENESRFEQAILPDFGHRSVIETAIAETLLVLGEIKHAAKHLKKWMAPQRVSTALQFMPAKNRLIPQPLGVAGIIAPWNCPLQLTLAPVVGAIAAGNRVMIKPSGYKDAGEPVSWINARDRPLALYWVREGRCGAQRGAVAHGLRGRHRQ